MTFGGFPHYGLLAAGLGVLLALSGCGGGGPRRLQSGRALEIHERDFHIDAPTRLPAGPTTFDVSNEGPDQHELIIVRSSGGTLPLRPDGLTVDEESIAASEPGALDPGQPGSLRRLAVNLTPGRYVFFCNMEGHFMGGMHRVVVVG